MGFNHGKYDSELFSLFLTNFETIGYLIKDENSNLLSHHWIILEVGSNLGRCQIEIFRK